ncbi:MAG: hypothetical protein R8K46_09760 [Mariprofundaceae bacterium]
MVKRLRVNLPILGFILAASGLFGCAVEQVAGIRDVVAGKPANPELPVVFVQTWQRTWRHNDPRTPYEAVGALKVTEEGVEFTHENGVISIPAASIRGVTFMGASYDVRRDWVTLEYKQGNFTRTVEFKAPPEAEQGADNRIYWALFESREAGLRKLDAKP